MRCTSLPLVLSICLSACGRESPSIDPWYPAVNKNGDLVSAVFEGRMPCAEPSLPDCDKVKVALALYQDNKSNAPTAYQLRVVYVGASSEGRLLEAGGSVVTTKGTKLDPNSTVLQLDEKAPPEFQTYWVIGDDILFLLDAQRKPKVGTASFSYVLNRAH